MRKAQKEQAVSFLQTLGQAHESLKRLIEQKNNDAYAKARQILEDCQQGAIELGVLIEKAEGENFVTIPMLEAYCELTYQIHLQLEKGEMVQASNVYKSLRKSLIRIENSVRNDIRERKEIVFLPYKASMWDSLESVWMAASADANCDVYVVPIPYYERNAEGVFGAFHYEGDSFPEYVPIVHYEKYCLQEQMPDVIFIHNPYDNNNFVTSVDPRFYSSELKKYTDCLVYIPYYVISGRMSEGQELCPAYLYADYIVIQAERHRRFFHPDLPQEKFLALGSPKLDRVVRLCQNPPMPPAAWVRRMELPGEIGKRKKVYFYNTSINGMLGDTKSFLNKMEYVFRNFVGREDACLVWRPHPLLESTFDSMRREYKPFYDTLKKFYREQNVGIYDDTPDIENTIAWCDAYIGDPASSVVPLFGVAGKPLFILNNAIHTLPEEGDWKGEAIQFLFPDGQDAWLVTPGNKLYYAQNHDYHYRYCCDLSEYTGERYYNRAIAIGGKTYVCPENAQDILVIGDKKIEKCVRLERRTERTGAFVGVWEIAGFLYLIPFRYPAIVRYDTAKDTVEYIEGYQDIFVASVKGEQRIGGSCVWNGKLLLASPVDDRVLVIEGSTGKTAVLRTGAGNHGGCMVMVPPALAGGASSDDEIFLLPFTGTVVVRWNPVTGEINRYGDVPAEFQCRNIPHGYVCMDKPFSMAVRSNGKLYLSPYWGNMSLCLDLETGACEKWEPPFPILTERKNGYYLSGMAAIFLYREDHLAKWPYRYFSSFDRRMYAVDLESGKYQEIEISFQREEVGRQEPGFSEAAEWLPYACMENSFQTLKQFLDGEIVGKPFDREQQMLAFEKIAVNHDGTCGEKVYHFLIENCTGGKGL